MKSRSIEAARVLQDLISGQNLPPGARLPSSRLLALQTGFPRYVMDRACQELLSGGSLIRDGYKLFVGAKGPARPSIEGEVCVVSYGGDFQAVARRTLAERGVKHRAVEISYTKHPSPLPVLGKVLAEKPAGVILWMPYWIEALVPLLEKEMTPLVVCADAAPPALPFSTVGTDLCRATETALRHLLDLGHRQVAFVSGYKASPVSLELAASFQKVCRQFGIPSAAIWYSEPWGGLHEMLVEQRKRFPEVTAIIGYVTVPALAGKTFKVLQELSLVCVYDPGPESQSALTAVTLRDPASCIASWACSEIITRIQAAESGRPMPPPRHALFVPELIDRGSARALAREEKAGVPAIGPIGPISPIGSAGASREAAAAASPWGSWRKTYAYLKKCRTHQWRHLDLSKLANHSMTREHGWLGGDPLLHFQPGLRSIHGVPFQVIEENRNGGRAVVTFRSPQTHSTEGKELPVRVKLPVRGRVKALYFLHGCGYARPAAFAEYRIHFKKGKAASIPLIPVGPSIEFARQRLGKLKPNVQDWWSGFEQQDFPHAKFVTVFNPADPGEYERYLYTLEWVNPHPGEEIGRIEARVDPEAGPALALVAVTALV